MLLLIGMNSEGKFIVLLVDDDSNFREILKAKLELEGYVIHEAVNGEDGIEKAKSIKPDLIVMDVQMPKMNGIEALSKIKSDESISGIKVIFVTNFGEMDTNDPGLDDKFAKEAGAVGHLRKTEDLSVIATRIKQELTPVS